MKYEKSKWERKIICLKMSYLFTFIVQYLPRYVSLHLKDFLANHRWAEMLIPRLVTSKSASKIFALRNFILFLILMWEKSPRMSVTKCSMHAVQNIITRRPPTDCEHSTLMWVLCVEHVLRMEEKKMFSLMEENCWANVR